MRYPLSPLQAAWLPYVNKLRWIKMRRFLKKLFGLDARQTVFGCPECVMPIDESLQKSNIRVELTCVENDKCDRVTTEPSYILSCPWCHTIINIGSVKTVDKKLIIARKQKLEEMNGR